MEKQQGNWQRNTNLNIEALLSGAVRLNRPIFFCHDIILRGQKKKGDERVCKYKNVCIYIYIYTHTDDFAKMDFSDGSYRPKSIPISNEKCAKHAKNKANTGVNLEHIN